MSSRAFSVLALFFCALIVYLFVSAPPPLPERLGVEARIPVEAVLALAEAENDSVRALWTHEIVGAGKKVGLAFGEDWREAGQEAGPLPALFLRDTARNLERDPVPLSLFLGSDAPINPANRFEGRQLEAFAEIRRNGEPQFFRMPDTGLYTAMFSDEAVTEACVTCHNEHEDSPRQDWKLHDVMGATTWAHPDPRLTSDEMLELLAALRRAFRDSYRTYLEKAATFANPPQIGARWPRDGYYLPSVDVFMDEHSTRASHTTVGALLRALDAPAAAMTTGRGTKR